MMEDVYRRGLTTVLVLWDMEKLFDCIDIERLIQQAGSVGFPSEVLVLGFAGAQSTEITSSTRDTCRAHTATWQVDHRRLFLVHLAGESEPSTSHSRTWPRRRAPGH